MEHGNAQPSYILVGHTHPAGTWRLPMHSHPFHELIVFFQGKSRISLETEALVGEPGDILFYRAGLPHEEEADATSRLETYFIQFEWPDAPESLPLRTFDADGKIRQMIQWVYQEQSCRGFRENRLKQLWFEAILEEWRRLPDVMDHPVLDSVRQYMQRNLHEELALDDIAAQAGMSKFHFSRLYRRHRGQSPMEDLQNMRLTHAHRRIITTTEPLKAIAAVSGFSSTRHMCRVFRQRLGYPPSALRKDA